jgi:hypothetical protein
VSEGLQVKESNENSLPNMYTTKGEELRTELGGEGKGGRGRVQVVFCLVVNKGT